MVETMETYQVTDNQSLYESFTNRFDALRFAVRLDYMVKIKQWRHTGERLQNGFSYKGDNSLKMTESVTLHELADHPWLTLHGEMWNRLAEAVATDIARGTGLYTTLDGLEYWQNEQEYIDQAEQHMTESGLKRVDL